MKSIFLKNDYEILLEVGKKLAIVRKGSNLVHVPLEPLRPLSALASKHLRMMGCDPKKYLNIGNSNHVILKEAAPFWEDAVAESAKVTRRERPPTVPVIKSIEFDEDNFQAGMSILSYFGTILKQKYPKTKVKIRIEQEGNTVRLIIESPTGEKEKIEKTLEDYGLVVVGQMLPKELLSDPLQVLQLQHKLDLSMMELMHTRELLNVAKSASINEMSLLKEQVLTLKEQISHALKREEVAASLLSEAITAFSLTGPAEKAVIDLIKHIEQGIQERDKDIVLDLLDVIKRQNSSAFEGIKAYLIASLGGATGNLLSSWVTAFYKAFPG